jgi:glutamyl-tRNA reductase
MAELAVEALRKRGASQITVVNRTLQRAQELSRRWNGQAAALEMLLKLLPDSDIVITSTGAPHTIIHKSMVADSMRQRAHRPIVFMDIAVPRDVDADVKDVPGVRLFDMDTLSQQLESSLAKRQAEVPHVKVILAEERALFMEYLKTLDIVPLIIELRQQINDIRQSELDKAIRRMPDLPPEAQQSIDSLTRSIVQKILHNPTIRLREVAGSPHASEYADITRGLFGLD